MSASSAGMVKRLLKEQGHGYRSQTKQLSTGLYGKRDQQFGIICHFVFIMGIKSPVLSIDCKKKERLGNLYRYGHLSGGKVSPQDL